MPLTSPSTRCGTSARCPADGQGMWPEQRPQHSRGGSVAAQNPQDLIARQVVGNDGGKLGKVDNVLVDQATGESEFISVRTGLFGMRESIVPLAEATTRSGRITVPYDAAQIKEAPNFDADHALSQDEESALYAHYGLDYGHAQSPTGLPEESAETSAEMSAQSVDQAGYDTS